MATQTRPFLKTGTALATAAAIAVAAPAIATNITPTPSALSAAKVELTTFSDLLSITPADWNNYLYVGWGGAIGPINVDPQTTESDYWAPQCDYNCLTPGLSGLLYLGLDALINGNGAGIANVGGILQNPSKPYQPDSTKPNYNPYTTQPWGTSAVNYFFEGGLSTGVQYVLQQPFATGAPLANQQIFDAIKLAFQVGSGNLWITAFTQTLATVAVLAESIPVIGQYLYRGIGSYIGPNFATIDTLYDYNAYAGIPGVLRYVGGVLTTSVTVGGTTYPIGNPNPYPTAAPEPTPTAAVAALSSPVAAAKTASPDAGTVTPAVVKAEVAAPKAGEAPAVESTPANSTPAAGGSSESTSTEAVSGTTVSDSKPADTTPAVDSPSSAVAGSTADVSPVATKPADAPAKAGKRPVRAAAERAAKKVASAISGAADAAAASVGGSR